MIDTKMNIEYIEWVDSFGCGSAWHDINEAKCIAHLCTSIGFVVSENDHALLIAPHFAPKNEEKNWTSVVGEMSIPKCCIKLRKTLEFKL